MTPQQYFTGMALSGVTAGTMQGISSMIEGGNFWWGSTSPSLPVSTGGSKPLTTDKVEARINTTDDMLLKPNTMPDIYEGQTLLRIKGPDGQVRWLPTNAAEETFSQAVFNGAENIGEYSVYGTKGLVGETFNRNIFLLETSNKSLSGFRSLIGTMESEAVGLGANKISIYGSSIVNDGFLNYNIAVRFGYSYQEYGSGIILQKILIP